MTTRNKIAHAIQIFAISTSVLIISVLYFLIYIHDQAQIKAGTPMTGTQYAWQMIATILIALLNIGFWSLIAWVVNND